MLDRWCALVDRVTVTPGHDAARAVFDDLLLQRRLRTGRPSEPKPFARKTLRLTPVRVS
jgi:hypothetical protein